VLEDEKRIGDLGRKAAEKAEVFVAELREKAIADWERSPAAKELADNNPDLWARSRTDPGVRAQCAFNAGYAPDAAELSRLIQDTPEQRQVEDIRQSRERVEADLGTLWMTMQPELGRLRTPSNDGLFVNLAQLPAIHSINAVDRRVALVEEVLARGMKGGRQDLRKQIASGAGVGQTKVVIKSLNTEGLTQYEICERLDYLKYPRPPRVRWRHLTWTAAYRDSKSHDAVKTWLSKAVAE
jgi:hypothetical protein